MSQEKDSESHQEEGSEPSEDYRGRLVAELPVLHQAYDKMIITLAGGALGLSITFFGNLLQAKGLSHSWLLLASWILFILSLASALARVLSGINARYKAIDQFDKETIQDEKAGGHWSSATEWMLWCSFGFLILGFCSIAVFFAVNLGETV